MKSFKENLPAIFVIMGIFALLGLGIYAVHLSNEQKPKSLAASGEVASAVVIDKLSSGGRYPTYSLVYEFENGNKMKEIVRFRQFDAAVPGDEVEVCFNDTYFTAFFEECGTRGS